MTIRFCTLKIRSYSVVYVAKPLYWLIIFLLVYRKDKFQSAIKIWKYYKFINGLVFLS